MTKDAFGINKIHETIPGGRIFMGYDYDARVAAVNRLYDGGGSTEMVIHGIGGITPYTAWYTLDGDAPRLYIYDVNDTLLWNNLEMTWYYMKTETSSYSWAGAVLGARSIHHRGGTNARTYYAKHHFTNKRIYVMKEHNHGGSGNDGYVDTYSSSLPEYELNDNVWYGMKFVVRTRESNGNVLLQVYRDTTNGLNGGTWTLVHEYEDTGSWNGYNPYTSGTSCMFRTDGITLYRIKRLSVRAIAGL